MRELRYLRSRSGLVVMCRKTSQHSVQRSDSRMDNELDYKLVRSRTNVVRKERVT